MIYQRKSMQTGEVNAMDVDATVDELLRWQLRDQTGETALTIFRSASPRQLFFITTGITEREYDSRFGEGAYKALFDQP